MITWLTLWVLMGSEFAIEVILILSSFGFGWGVTFDDCDVPDFTPESGGNYSIGMGIPGH